MQRQHDPLRTIREVVTQEVLGARTPPLLFKHEVIEVVVEVDEESAGETARGQGFRTAGGVSQAAEGQRSGEMSTRHHAGYSRTLGAANLAGWRTIYGSVVQFVADIFQNRQPRSRTKLPIHTS